MDQITVETYPSLLERLHVFSFEQSTILDERIVRMRQGDENGSIEAASMISTVLRTIKDSTRRTIVVGSLNRILQARVREGLHLPPAQQFVLTQRQFFVFFQFDG
ncbi:hypothetical protein CRE_10357 [Caenorhabditis remanei]|uniref:Uncharacterized protein n=1 Tax=Caenorhabditis remanei TaxID=31234 RepID=E3MQJ3_CAERE|nr:hypothetical protein CRE_10357 [Caenorhabditis remanei]